MSFAGAASISPDIVNRRQAREISGLEAVVTQSSDVDPHDAGVKDDFCEGGGRPSNSERKAINPKPFNSMVGALEQLLGHARSRYAN
jgi:hypothetical protein